MLNFLSQSFLAVFTGSVRLQYFQLDIDTFNQQAKTHRLYDFDKLRPFILSSALGAWHENHDCRLPQLQRGYKNSRWLNEAGWRNEYNLKNQREKEGLPPMADDKKIRLTESVKSAG
jgi:hypothetical protein